MLKQYIQRRLTAYTRYIQVKYDSVSKSKDTGITRVSALYLMTQLELEENEMRGLVICVPASSEWKELQKRMER